MLRGGTPTQQMVRQYVKSLHIEPRSLDRNGVTRYDTDARPQPSFGRLKRWAHAVLTTSGYVLPEARTAFLAQEQAEWARQRVYELFGVALPRLCCPRLVAERERNMSPSLRARLEANALKQSNDAADANIAIGGRETAEEAKALSLVTTYCPAVIRSASSLHLGATQEEKTIDARIRQHDELRGAQRMRRLPYVEGDVDHYERLAGDLASDADLHRGPVHAAELRRRERKRLYAYLSSGVRGDHTLLDVYAPLWEKRPEGLRPHASNPAAMWRAYPEYEQACTEIDDSLPTSPVATSERHENFRVGHMWHCRRCWRYSEKKWGTPAPVATLKEALTPGWKDPGGWSVDPKCYQRLQIHFIRTGFEARVDPSVESTTGRERNPPNVYEEYDKMVDYLESLDTLPFKCISKGQFTPPPVASGLLAVVRDSDRRAWEGQGVPYPVRPCINLRTSGVNDMFYDWPFRMAGVSSAVRLLSGLRTTRRGRSQEDPDVDGSMRRTALLDETEGRPAVQPQLQLADGKQDLPRPAEQWQLQPTDGEQDSLSRDERTYDGDVPLSGRHTVRKERPARSRETRSEKQPGETARVELQVDPHLQMGRRSRTADLGVPLGNQAKPVLSSLTAVQTEIENEVRTALAYVDNASDAQPLYLSVTDMSKYYLYLALGRKTQQLTYFSDPRYEKEWGGKKKPPPDWKKRRRGRFGRWRHFVTCPFGLKPLVAYSSAISGEIGQMLIALGIPNNFFIDDDLQVKRGRLSSRAAAVVAEKVMTWLGFVAKASKRQGPARVLRYLGFIFDLNKGELRVTPEHRDDLLKRCLELREAQKISEKELSRLCGKLNWVAQVMWGGVTFIRNILNLMRPPENGELPAFICLTAAANRHLDYWIERLQDPDWEGSWIIPTDHQMPVVTFKSDASGDKMWGYYYGGKLYWCSPVEQELPETHIQFRELLPLAHAARHLGQRWTNRVVRVGVDNSTVAYAINRGSSPDEWMQSLLEMIAVASRQHHFVFLAVHVDRRFNYLADMCTRFQVLQDFEAVLPPGVVVPPDPGHLMTMCPERSPFGSSVVFSLPLAISAEGA